MDNLRGDKYTRRFLTTDTAGNPGSDAVGEWEAEDPTYLGFRIEFMFQPIEARSAVVCGLLLPKNNTDSAISYLLRVGEYERAVMLENFISDLKKISEEYPWYFTSVSGLQKLVQIDMNSSTRIAVDDFIEVECLESIDLRITKMFDLYRKATYDTIYMRDLLPSNLRAFNTRIHVTEIRKFHTFTKAAGIKDPKDQSFLMRAYEGISDVYNLSKGISNALNSSAFKDRIEDRLPDGISPPFVQDFKMAEAKIRSLDNFISVLTFNLMHCTLFLDDFSPFLETVTNGSDTAAATQKFKMHAHRATESNSYTVAKLILRDVIQNSIRPVDGTEPERTPQFDDIIQYVYPNVKQDEDLDNIKAEKEKKLWKDQSIKEKLFTGYKKYDTFKNDLDEKLRKFGINYNPIDMVESELLSRGNSIFERLVLGNIHGVAPTNLIETIKNGLRKQQEDALKITQSPLEGVTPNYKSESNIGLEGKETNFTAQPSINLESNPVDYKTQPSMDFKENKSDFKIVDEVDLEVESKDLTIQPITLTEPATNHDIIKMEQTLNQIRMQIQKKNVYDKLINAVTEISPKNIYDKN